MLTRSRPSERCRLTKAKALTTERHSRTPGFTAEVHFPGIVQQSSASADDDPFPPPRSLTTED